MGYRTCSAGLVVIGKEVEKMKYRIMYCQNCGEEYENVLAKWGEKCDKCDTKLSKAFKVIEKNYSCIKFIEK